MLNADLEKNDRRKINQANEVNRISTGHNPSMEEKKYQIKSTEA